MAEKKSEKKEFSLATEIICDLEQENRKLKKREKLKKRCMELILAEDNVKTLENMMDLLKLFHSVGQGRERYKKKIIEMLNLIKDEETIIKIYSFIVGMLEA